jgi:WD repeat-containing protein 23
MSVSMQERIMDYSVSIIIAYQFTLTSCFLDSVHRRNRDIPIDAATQYFTLHLYSTKEMGHIKKAPRQRRRPVRPAAGGQTGAVSAQPTDDDDDDDDYEDEDDMPWGGFGNRARNAPPHEDSSMKKIKTVQGEEGRWTVTDCDADKKAEK